eukprot:CAMPEP_0181291110 /NCGR_PEP_ID=MMETSP1101-20121128/1786_1 /TAXON_ID=46948 /ORGANISM="Rhodomonas abbreviata, Strain Caron Lab Isolate" /LENGTH=64 /DNA_ID=CAMNT_0023395467 /DNA_START=38 /DNA_END=232 /DNA_ORIENTATION=+
MFSILSHFVNARGQTTMLQYASQAGGGGGDQGPQGTFDEGYQSGFMAGVAKSGFGACPPGEGCE